MNAKYIEELQNKWKALREEINSIEDQGMHVDRLHREAIYKLQAEQKREYELLEDRRRELCKEANAMLDIIESAKEKYRKEQRLNIWFK
jgi:hypothetical protein